MWASDCASTTDYENRKPRLLYKERMSDSHGYHMIKRKKKLGLGLV